MNIMRSVTIKYILNADPDHLKKMFIAANTFAGGLTDADKLDPMTEYIIDKLQGMKYLDKEMVYGLIVGIDGAKGKAAKV